MSSPTTPRSGSTVARRRVGQAVLMTAVFVTAVDMTVLFLAIPHIAADLTPSGTQQLWTLHVGDLVGAGLVLTAGRLVDRFGARRLLVVGLSLFATASLLAALSTTIEMLLAARVLLGASAVTVAPAGMALLRRMHPTDRGFSRAVAFFMASFSGGMALGPPIAGVLLQHASWPTVFLVNVPIVVLVLLGTWTLPAGGGTSTGGVDVPSVAFSLGGVGLLVWGVQETMAGGVALTPSVAVLVALLLGWAFVRRQRRVDEPLLELSLLRSRAFTLSLLAIWLTITVTVSADLHLAQYLQVVMDLPASTTGLLLVVPAGLSMVATACSPALLTWLRPSSVMALGASFAAAGSAGALLSLAADEPSVPLLVLSASALAIGIAPIFSLATNILLVSAPEHLTGSAQAAQEVSGSLGNTSGIALGGSVAFLVYSGSLAGTVPDGTTAEAAEQSRQSIGGALAAADDLGAAGSALEQAAVAAFAQATAATFVLALVGTLALAVLTGWGLRRAVVTSSIEEQTPEPTRSELV